MTAFGEKSDGPLVSVLVPTFNRRRYLAEALASLVRQTYPHFEAFIINDGGERVDDVVASFNDPRLTLLERRENRGKAHSLNQALRHARGKYVAYLDDDDLYYPMHLARLVEALETQAECQAAYTDLYKVHCRLLPDGSRQVLGKIVNITRDFDRFLLCHFNHVLHVSLMHRRDLLDKTGPYDENLRVMIDWDMTRRLSFFTDFRHLTEVTGEFYGPVGDCDRLSYRLRLDKASYVQQVMSIRAARPPKPWPKMPDLSIVLLADALDAAARQTLLQMRAWTFMPYEVYLPVPDGRPAGGVNPVPNVVPVPVAAGTSRQARLDAALARTQGDCVAVLVPGGFRAEPLWIENPLHAALHHAGGVAFSVGRPAGEWPAVVLRRADLVRSRQARATLSLRASLAAAGIAVREPAPSERPFQFDALLQQAEALEREGQWVGAARIYGQLESRGANRRWMRERTARALYRAGGRDADARRLCTDVNQRGPTVSTLQLEAGLLRRAGDCAAAAALLEDAERMLSGTVPV